MISYTIHPNAMESSESPNLDMRFASWKREYLGLFLRIIINEEALLLSDFSIFLFAFALFHPYRAYIIYP